MGRYMLLWLLGVPIPVLVLIWFFVLRACFRQRRGQAFARQLHLVTPP